MIPLFKVHIPKNLDSTLQKVFETGIVTEGEYSNQFENEFSKLVDNKFCSLVNSGTSALTLAYRMAGITIGDEVITTPMTCMATNEPLDTMGATIKFADIDPETGNIDPNSVEKLITNKTKAIVGVHWAGQPFEIDEIKEIINNRKSDIILVEDAAHALGASYKNKQIGSHSDFVCFSFQAIKHLTTIDGGAIMSRSDDVDKRIKKLRWFGLDRNFVGSKWTQDIVESGYKFHMNNVNAAIGLEQLKYIDDIIRKHKENGLLYDNEIINTKKVRKLKRVEHSKSSYWIYSLLVDDIERFKTHMQKYKISCDVVHVRNDKYSVFKRFRNEKTPGADEFCDHMINIPVGWWLTSIERNAIIHAVNEY